MWSLILQGREKPVRTGTHVKVPRVGSRLFCGTCCRPGEQSAHRWIARWAFNAYKCRPPPQISSLLKSKSVFTGEAANEPLRESVYLCISSGQWFESLTCKSAAGSAVEGDNEPLCGATEAWSLPISSSPWNRLD